MFEVFLLVVVYFLVLLLIKYDDRRTDKYNRQAVREQQQIHRRERELGLTGGPGLDMAAALRNSPMGPRNERVQEIDWVIALGLNTTTWRVTDPDDGTTVYTDDVSIAIDNLVYWDSEVAPVEQPERLEPWLTI